MTLHHTSHRGFTLIELSIVMVIVALIVSGVVVGRSMLEAAETRTVASEFNMYTTSFKEFIDKYQAIPGDMNNAENYWGSDASCPATSTNTTQKKPTCNGNADGMIGDWTNTATATANSEREWFRAWQQLANAQLIEGLFTGVSGSTSTSALIGTNVPASKTGKGGWTLLFMASDGTTDTTFFNSATSSHVLMYGNQTTGSFTDTAIFTPSQMQSLDDKTDDGMPYTGKLRVKKSTAAACTDAALTTSTYLSTSSAQACQLLFLMGM